MNQNQASTFKTEQGELFAQVKNFGREFDKENFRYRLGGFISRNGMRGFWAPFEFENFFMIVLSIFLRLLLLIVLCCICGNFLAGLIVHSAIHIALIITGICIVRKAEKNLIALENAINEKYNEYAERQYKQYCITNKNSVVFDNGLVVENGIMTFPMCRDFGDIRILQLTKDDEKEAYKEIIDAIEYNTLKKVSLNKHIASVQFTKNFGVITNDDNLLQAMGYMSPTVQLHMINNVEALKKYSFIHADNGCMKLGTSRYVPIPESFDRHDKYQSVIGYFDDIDRYCQELLEMGYKAYNELQQLSFLQGNL